MATNGKKKNTLPHLGHSQTAFEVSRILLFSGHWVLARRIVKPGKRLPEAVVQSPPLTMFKAQLDKAWPTLFDVEIFSRRVEWVTSRGPFQSRFFCYSNNIHSKWEESFLSSRCEATAQVFQCLTTITLSNSFHTPVITSHATACDHCLSCSHSLPLRRVCLIYKFS